MTSENPISRKFVKGQALSGLVSRDGNAPDDLGKLIFTNTPTPLGYIALEQNYYQPGGRKFLQGIPVTREIVNSLNDREADREVARQDPLAIELHREDGRLGRRQLTNFEDNVGYEVPTLMDRIDPLYEYYDLKNPETGLYWHPVRIMEAGRGRYFTEELLDAVRMLPRQEDRVKRICRYVGANPEFPGGGQTLGSAIHVEWSALNRICEALDENLYACSDLKRLAKSYLDAGYKLEMVSEGAFLAGVPPGVAVPPLWEINNRQKQILELESSGSVTNFSLQVPVAIDDCSVEDLFSHITTGIETATAEPVYQFYIDPDTEPTLRFPPNSGLESWPNQQIGNQAYYGLWDSVLKYEINLQADNRNTYYGNLDSKDKDGFPRYSSLSIPTYQDGSLVQLFNGLSAEENIYPHVIRMMGNMERSEDELYNTHWQYYHHEGGWTNDSASFGLRRTRMGTHLRHLQAGHDSEADLFDVEQDQTAAELQMGIDLSGLPPGAGFMPDIQTCPPFSDRIRAMLAEEANENLMQEILDRNAYSRYGLFLGMIMGEINYTEPLFYEISRDRYEPMADPSDSPIQNPGHLIVKPKLDAEGNQSDERGEPILGAQPIYHSNKVENSYFTFEDRFVDYGDMYQYNVDAYSVVIRNNFITNILTNRMVDCLPNPVEGDSRSLSAAIISKLRTPEKLVNFSLVAIKSDLDIIKIPYVHTDYLQTNEFSLPPRNKTAVALPPVYIVDKPPIAPGVTIIPYRNIADKMLFMFDQQTDEVIDEYIYLNNAEKSVFEAIHLRQKRQICDLCENSVEFRTEDEDIEKIQIFKTTTVPEIMPEQNPSQMYQDTFGDEPYREIMLSEGSAFVDDIESNTKYFYMFRSKDKNGHVSNPSEIYRVEMVEEDGLIFPIIELYTPKATKRSVKYRKMAKHLEIKPSLLISEPNWSADDDGNVSWKIGSRDDQIFGATKGQAGPEFKIRLTSIDTGRKMELKVRFNKETNKVEAIENRDLGE